MEHNTDTLPCCALCSSNDLGQDQQALCTSLSPDWGWTNGVEELPYGDGTRVHDALKRPWEGFEDENIFLDYNGEGQFRQHAMFHLTGKGEGESSSDSSHSQMPVMLAFFHDPTKTDSWVRSLAQIRLVNPDKREYSLEPLEPKVWRTESRTAWMEAAAMTEQDLRSHGDLPASNTTVVRRYTRLQGMSLVPYSDKAIFVHYDCMQILVSKLVGKRIDRDLTPEDWLLLNHEALGVALHSLGHLEEIVDMLAAERRYPVNPFEARGIPHVPLCFPKRGLLQKVLKRVLFQTDRFSKELGSFDVTEPTHQDSVGAFLNRFPNEIFFHICAYLEPEDIRNMSVASRHACHMLQSEQFWLSWLMSGFYDDIFPELRDVLKDGIPSCEKEGRPKPKWRQFAGWLEMITVPTNVWCGWGTVLQSRMAVTAMADIVERRYREVQSKASWALADPRMTHCMEPTLVLSHETEELCCFGPIDFLSSYETGPFVSTSLIPGPKGSLIRLQYEARKPMIQLSDACHTTGEQSVLEADDLVIVIEFWSVVGTAQRTAGIVRVKFRTRNGKTISLAMPGYEDCAPERVLYYHAPTGFLFLDQIYSLEHLGCCFEESIEMDFPPDWKQANILAFRGITQGKVHISHPESPTPIDCSSTLSRIYWSPKDITRDLGQSIAKDEIFLKPDQQYRGIGVTRQWVCLDSPDEIPEEPEEWVIYRRKGRYTNSKRIMGVQRAGHAVVGISPEATATWSEEDIERFELSSKTDLVAIFDYFQTMRVVPRDEVHNYPDHEVHQEPLFADGMFCGIAWTRDFESIMKWRPGVFKTRG